MHIQGYLQRHLFSYIKQSYQVLLVIIIIDLIPLFGVLFWGWGTMDAVYLYFFETLILCIVTYLKMKKAGTLLAVTGWQVRLAKKADKAAGNVGKLALSAGKKSYGLVRWLVAFAFLIINIPLCLLLMMIMLGIDGKGFSLGSVLGYDGGHTDLFVMDVNTFYIMVALLTFEHFYTYRSKYVNGKEYESSGVLNEALAFEFRVIIQSIVMIGGIALIFFLDFSKVMVIILIIIKTLIDVFAYLRNRYWSSFVEWMEKDSKPADDLIISA